MKKKYLKIDKDNIEVILSSLEKNRPLSMPLFFTIPFELLLLSLVLLFDYLFAYKILNLSENYRLFIFVVIFYGYIKLRYTLKKPNIVLREKSLIVRSRYYFTQFISFLQKKL